jgi:hypothetical protein
LLPVLQGKARVLMPRLERLIHILDKAQGKVDQNLDPGMAA